MMTMKSTKTKNRIAALLKGYSKYLLLCFLLTGLYSTSVFATSLSNNVPSAVLTDLKLGSSNNLYDVLGKDIGWTYVGNSTDTLTWFSQNFGFTPTSGYDFFPDTSNVTINPSTQVVTNNSTTTTSVNITIPVDTSLLGQKYQVRVYGQSAPSNGGAGAGAITNIYLELSSLYIGYGVTGYSALNQIGLLGDDVYLTTNVAGPTAMSTRLYFRKTGDTAWTTKTAVGNPVTKSDSTKDITFKISASDITTSGFQFVIYSSAGTDYAYSPDQTTTVFNSTAVKFFPVTVSRITAGVISASGSTVNVTDGNPNDGAVKIVAPRGAVSADTAITLEQIDPTSSDCPATPSFSLSDKPAMIFKFTPDNTRFDKSIQLSLLYLDLNSDGIVDDITNKADGSAINATDLKMFFWDGFKWRLVNGTQTHNTDHTVTVSTDHFSYYALFPVASLSPEDYRPAKKIITPNGDGVNDDADFNGLAEEIKIYDITGRKIRTVDSSAGKWDGKDDGGKVVESGVYIYQFKVDGTLVSGCIAVAK